MTNQILLVKFQEIKRNLYSTKFLYPKYTVLRIKTLLEDSTYTKIWFINSVKWIGIANSIETAKDFAAIKMINSLSNKDKKCEIW